MQRLTEEEIELLRKMNNLATFVKSSVVGMILAFAMMIYSIVIDIVCYFNNVSRNVTLFNLIVGAVAAIGLTTVWGICIVIVERKQESDKTWASILEKYDGDFDLHVEAYESDMTKIYYDVTLVNVLVEKSKKLQQTGNAMRDMAGRVSMSLTLVSCSDIKEFSKNVALVNNVKLRKNVFAKIVGYLPAAIMIAIGVFVTSTNLVLASGQRKEVEKILAADSDVKWETVSNERITYFDSDENHYEIKLNDKFKVKEIQVSLTFDASMEKEEIVDGVNASLSQIYNKCRKLGLDYAEEYPDEGYELPYNFLEQFENTTIRDFRMGYDIYNVTEFDDGYRMNCYARLRTTVYGDTTDELVISVEVVRY